ncbi:hypothetical protein IFM51744_06141 [Aspergillus udagawae]|nr:hypothetical protein IFM51744_06141 [Aspergillus udagawae]
MEQSTYNLSMEEDSPLLPSSCVSAPEEDRGKATWQAWKVPLLCYACAILLDWAQVMRATPKVRLFESILCERYYSARSLEHLSQMALPESMCKIAPIQKDLVAVQAWLKLGDNLCALVTARLFGQLASSQRRTLVLTLGVWGQVLAEAWIVVICRLTPLVPFETVYVSIILRAVGGGEMVLSAIVHAILADVVPEGKRAEAFFHLASTTLLSEIFAPAIGSVLMDKEVYAPLLAGLPLQVISLVAIAILPKETELLREPTDALTDREAGYPATQHSVWQILRRQWPFFLVHVSFLTSMLARETLDFLVQYISRRLNWSLSKVVSVQKEYPEDISSLTGQANYIVSLKSLFNLILFLYILPVFKSRLVQHDAVHPSRVDLWIARASAAFGVTGLALLGFSSSPLSIILSLIIYTLSSGYPHVLQSYGTSMLPSEAVTSFYTSLAMVRIFGTLVGSPLLAMAFRAGLGMEEAGMGLAFYVAAGLFGISTTGAWALS